MRAPAPDFPLVLLLRNCVVEMGTQADTCCASVLLESSALRYALFVLTVAEVQQYFLSMWREEGAANAAVIVKLRSYKVGLPWVQLFKYKANVDMGQYSCTIIALGIHSHCCNISNDNIGCRHCIRTTVFLVQ